MSVGLGAPWVQGNMARPKSPVNPMDKSTIVSIFPKRIVEKKVTIFPSFYILEPGTFEKPFCLTIGPASWYSTVLDGMPTLEVPQSSLQVADSVVSDYVNSLMEFSTDAYPGIFYLPGSHTSEYISKPGATIKIDENVISIKHVLESALQRQRNWYHKLIRQADIIWSRTNGNPTAINEDMRLAASELNMQGKPWMENTVAASMTNCPACGFLRNGNFPVCQNCRTIIDHSKFKEMGLVSQPQN